MLSIGDQENLASVQQNAAAGKALNQNLRGLQPKTPANRPPKTPFRQPQHDENRAFTIKNGIGAAGGNENVLRTRQKDGKQNQESFVTPLGPRIRAPLGNKTTNAKGQAFQTPAPILQTTKPLRTVKRPSTARRSAKAKINVASTEPVKNDVLSVEEDDVPEIEYCPPPPIELPDPPEEFGYDQSFPEFQGQNYCRGFEEVFFQNTREEDQRRRKEYELRCKQFDEDVERQILESLNDFPDPDAEADRQVERMLEAGPKSQASKASNPNTVRARNAAEALNQPSLPSNIMRPTASSLQKTKKKPAFSVLSSKHASNQDAEAMPHRSPARDVSRNTIGFPKARKAPSIIPLGSSRISANDSNDVLSVVTQSDIHPARFRELYGEPPVGSDMWLRLQSHELLMRQLADEEQDDAAEQLEQFELFHHEGTDDDDIFQLPMAA